MHSQSSSRFVASSPYTYAVSLRVRHPSINPAVLTDTLKLEPVHSWKAGEPRQSQDGEPIGGQYRDSYWSAPLPNSTVGRSRIPLELFLRQQLLQLLRHKGLLERVRSEGGEASLLVELSPDENAVLTLSSAIARNIAVLELEVEFQFLSE
jgi:hypothetical protein